MMTTANWWQKQSSWIHVGKLVLATVDSSAHLYAAESKICTFFPVFLSWSQPVPSSVRRNVLVFKTLFACESWGLSFRFRSFFERCLSTQPSTHSVYLSEKMTPSSKMIIEHPLKSKKHEWHVLQLKQSLWVHKIKAQVWREHMGTAVSSTIESATLEMNSHDPTCRLVSAAYLTPLWSKILLWYTDVGTDSAFSLHIVANQSTVKQPLPLHLHGSFKKHANTLGFFVKS